MTETDTTQAPQLESIDEPASGPGRCNCYIKKDRCSHCGCSPTAIVNLRREGEECPVCELPHCKPYIEPLRHDVGEVAKRGKRVGDDDTRLGF